MAAKPFGSVTIEIAHATRTITSVREAAEVLLDDWPTQGRRRAYRAATRACRTALSGSGSAYKTRIAFIDAAREVGIFVKAEEG